MTRTSHHVTIAGLKGGKVREFSRLLARGFSPALAGSQIGLGPNEAEELAGSVNIRRTVQQMQRLDNAKPRPDLTKAARRKCLMCQTGFNSDGPGHRVCDACKKSDRWRTPVQDVELMA